MEPEHIISEEALDEIIIAVAKGDNWIAYNSVPYFLNKEDVYSFGKQDEAVEFAGNNVSEYDCFKVIHVLSADDAIKKISQLILKTNFMNEKNFEYLKDNIKYMGFGEKLNEQLENNLKQGKDEFQLGFKTEINKKPFEANLNFRKSDNTDMYFFNSYNASLQRSNGEKVDQTFYLNHSKGVTAKEAYNLLEGRSVHKDLVNKDDVPYKAWIQLDFKERDKNNNHKVDQFHENYGFDLKAAVSKFPVTDLKDPEKEKALMQSLQKGNVQSVAIEKDGSTHKIFIEANPQFKTVNLFDGQMKRVQKEALDQYKSVSQGQDKEISKDQKQDVKQEVNKDNKQAVSKEISAPKQTKSPSKKKSMSM